MYLIRSYCTFTHYTSTTDNLHISSTIYILCIFKLPDIQIIVELMNMPIFKPGLECHRLVTKSSIID